MQFDDNRLYSMRAVSEALGININTLRNFRLEGRVKAIPMGRVYRVRGSEVNYILANGLHPVTEEYRAEAAKQQAAYRKRRAARESAKGKI